MKFYNILDEKDRFVGLKVTDENGKQENSHTYSYLCEREIEKECGYAMGLDELDEQF